MARVFSTGTQSSWAVCQRKAGQVRSVTWRSRPKYWYSWVPGSLPLTFLKDPSWACWSAVITG